VFCLHAPAPPDGALADVPPPQAARTEREWLAMHRKNPSCDSCHRMIDGLGLGLSHFDVVGRYLETTPAGKVDATGEIRISDPEDGPYDGHRELGQRLARSKTAAACHAKQWLRYALGREVTGADEAALAQVRARAAAPKGTLADLILAIAESPVFAAAAIQPVKGE
jgi:hypothetical protein